MARIHCFEPIQDNNTEILILGTMLGHTSLVTGQYYAHPQNSFWRIMSALLQFKLASPYEIKVLALISAHIALWDVLQSCKRKGSLDARIEHDTQIANDFQTFFNTHPRIRHIFFNGAKAEHLFKQYVPQNINLNRLCLPSTSPAHAAMTFDKKLDSWRIILDFLPKNPKGT